MEHIFKIKADVESQHGGPCNIVVKKMVSAQTDRSDFQFWQSYLLSLVSHGKSFTLAFSLHFIKCKIAIVIVNIS